MTSALTEQIRGDRSVNSPPLQTLLDVVIKGFAVAEDVLQDPKLRTSLGEPVLNSLEESIIDLANYGFTNQARDAALRYEALKSEYGILQTTG